MDWEALFIPTGSLLEIFIRGTVIYIALFLALRFVPRRTVGAMGPSDLLVIVLIADAVLRSRELMQPPSTEREHA